MSDHLIVEASLATGAALIIVGVAVIYWPAAMIVAGLMIFTLVGVALIMDEPDQPEFHHVSTQDRWG